MTRLVPGSVAERAGLRAGDVIVEINGTPTEGSLIGDLAKAFRRSPVTLLIERDGALHSITMSLEDD